MLRLSNTTLSFSCMAEAMQTPVIQTLDDQVSLVMPHVFHMMSISFMSLCMRAPKSSTRLSVATKKW